MVKKMVLCIHNSEDSENNLVDIEEMLTINTGLHSLIDSFKNKITSYYENKTWDKFKKISNEYEMIFTTPNTSANISSYSPVSRSFFKMWEILQDFKADLNLNSNKIKVCMLCEGPGGFAEAIIKYRNNINDSYVGMSLKSNNDRNIPEWKLKKELYDRVDICYGADDTGDLYNFANITFLAKHIGHHTVDLITADGGFDFSSDFNNQEEMSVRLLYAEIMSALILQKEGGGFVLKIYDLFTDKSLNLLHILQNFYKTINIVKPHTSRPANSEKYLVCTNFQKNNEAFQNIFKELFSVITNIPHVSFIQYKPSLLKNIICYNTYYTLRQMIYIQKTIDYIILFRINKISSKWLLQNIHDEHKQKCLKWCKKYNI